MRYTKALSIEEPSLHHNTTSYKTTVNFYQHITTQHHTKPHHVYTTKSHHTTTTPPIPTIPIPNTHPTLHHKHSHTHASN